MTRDNNIIGELDAATLAILDGPEDTQEAVVFASALDRSFGDYLDAHEAFGPVADEDGEVEVWVALLI